jgi:hypothetical protein
MVVSCGNVGLQAVQIVVVGAGNGWLYHTLLDSAGVWQSNFRSIADQVAGDPPFAFFETVDCAAAADALQVIALGGSASLNPYHTLWHTFRASNGGWQGRWGSVQSQSSGGPPGFTDVACASSDGQALQVVGLGTDGKLWHTYRAAAGGWQPAFAPVANQSTGGPPSFMNVAAAGAQGFLHVVAVGSDGQLWHTIRADNSSWQPAFGAIGSQSAGGPGSFTSVACGIDDNWNLQVIGIGTDGKLYRTRRNVDGTWAPRFDAVPLPASGGPTGFRDVAVVRAAPRTFAWSR